MQDLLNAFAFVSDHIHIAGWVFLITLSFKISWKASKFLGDLSDNADDNKDTAEKIKEMQQTMNALATNHLPHILEELKGLRSDMFQYFLAKNKE